MFACLRLVIDQHAHRRGIKIIKLTAANRPDARPESSRTKGNRDGQGDVQHAHRVIPGVLGEARVRPNTVRLLNGIRAAAINGVIHPVIASPTATTL